jgi:hypothetical protein
MNLDEAIKNAQAEYTALLTQRGEITARIHELKLKLTGWLKLQAATKTLTPEESAGVRLRLVDGEVVQEV